MKKIIWLLCFWLVACTSGGPIAPAQIDPPFPPAGPVGTTAKVFPVETGWHDGQKVQYYNLGMQTALDLDDPTRMHVEGGWVLITGMNADGSPQKVPGQGTLFDVQPGDVDYSDLWQIYLVRPPEGYQANSVKSTQALEQSGYPIEKTIMLVNCPIVPLGSSLSDNALPLQKSWVKEMETAYFDFGVTSPTPGKVFAFVTGFDANHQPQLVAGQHFIFSARRTASGYSDFWRVQWVTVDTYYQPDSIKSVADIPPAQISESNLVVNYPQK